MCVCVCVCLDAGLKKGRDTETRVDDGLIFVIEAFARHLNYNLIGA